MFTRPAPRIRFAFVALAVTLALPGAAVRAGELRFVEGDPRLLSCRVVKASALHPDVPSALLEIAVRNEGAVAAEPLVFDIAADGKTVAVPRVEPPHERRAGRPVPPKGEVRYFVLAPVTARAAAKLGTVGVSVGAASFVEGEMPASKPLVSVSRPRVENAEYTAVLGRYLKCSIVEVENRGPRTIDLVFRARFDQPKKVEGLLAYRAEPGRKSTWVVEDVPRGVEQGSWGEPEIAKLELVDWCEIHGDVPAAAPVAELEATLVVGGEAEGELASRLRSVWEAPYRYPDAKVRLEGRFRLDNPGTDALWRGLKRVEGTFVLDGFSGGKWATHSIEFDADSVPAALRAPLADVVDDRFRMWFTRDAAARRPFDEAFAAATVTGTPDRMEIAGGSVRRVEAKDDRLAGLALEGDDRERRFDWTTAFGATVAKAIRTGDEETLTATWLDAGGGYVLPGRVHMKGVFADWGPETIEFSKWRVVAK